MAQSSEHRTEHDIVIQAPPGTVYDLIASVDRWPLVFPPTIHAERLEVDGELERIRLWATANDTVKSWTSLRTLDPLGLTVGFRQEVSQHPVAAMSGEWILEPLPEGRTRVRLTHSFRAADDSTENTAWINRAIDTNSDRELAALRTAAERESTGAELEFTFEDTVAVQGSAKDVYDFLNEADQWERRLPHVARVVLTEDSPGVQSLEMDTRAPDGSVHTTRSVRVCRPYESIVYKQLRTPALLSAHTGRWHVRGTGSTTTVSSAHSVVIAPSAIPAVLGDKASVADARRFLRDALGRNSLATMELAKEYAASRRTAG
ncbi:aromatase/cyclase [Streptomyces cyaneofuscatus]|uniref:aromatase/cyclase n=1 Tax=Streptomyces cyaneofuscatus TaxID=66883 RepID=UPI0033A2A75C